MWVRLKAADSHFGAVSFFIQSKGQLTHKTSHSHQASIALLHLNPSLVCFWQFSSERCTGSPEEGEEGGAAVTALATSNKKVCSAPRELMQARLEAGRPIIRDSGAATLPDRSNIFTYRDSDPPSDIIAIFRPLIL